MARKDKKRLAIKSETLRHLSLADLGQVAGGAARGTTRCSHTDDWTYTCDANSPKKP